MLLNIYGFLTIISILKENHVLYFPNCKTHFFFEGGVENVYKILASYGTEVRVWP